MPKIPVDDPYGRVIDNFAKSFAHGLATFGLSLEESNNDKLDKSKKEKEENGYGNGNEFYKKKENGKSDSF